MGDRKECLYQKASYLGDQKVGDCDIVGVSTPKMSISLPFSSQQRDVSWYNTLSYRLTFHCFTFQKYLLNMPYDNLSGKTYPIASSCASNELPEPHLPMLCQFYHAAQNRGLFLWAMRQRGKQRLRVYTPMQYYPQWKVWILTLFIELFFIIVICNIIK